MTTASRGRLIALLLRAGFLAAALAIIAGIFGMHIMTGSHSMSALATPMAADDHAAVQLHTSGGHSSQGAAEPAAVQMTPAAAAAGSSATCSSSGICPEMSAGGAACVPAPANTSLTAPLPGTAPYAVPDFTRTAALGTNYSHSPDSPSPGDLCISRT